MFQKSKERQSRVLQQTCTCSKPLKVLFEELKTENPNLELAVFAMGTKALDPSDTWKPAAFASHSLSDTECRFVQIEKKALTVTWASEKFPNYLIGMSCYIETDHKPLVSLLSTKDLSDIPSTAFKNAIDECD